MRRNGFTLIELMIAVAVVAILASIVYPSYIASVQKTRRSDAKAALMAIAQQLERTYTQQNTYVGATLGTGGLYPAVSSNGYYSLTLPVANLTTSAYIINATPIGVQASDDCGVFTLDEQGNQGVTGGTITDPTQCW